MKKTLLLVSAFVFVFCMAAPVRAADMPKSVNKIVNGTKDVLKSPIAAYDATKAEVKAADFKPFGLLKGLVKAPFHLVKKAGAGIMSIATFPIE